MSDQKNTQPDMSKHRPKNLHGGRPELFPGVKIEKRSVTLPAELWRYIETLDSSISTAIFGVLDKKMKRSMRTKK